MNQKELEQGLDALIYISPQWAGVARGALTALARKDRVIVALLQFAPDCPIEHTDHLDMTNKFDCPEDPCIAPDGPPEREQEMGCWRAWAEAEADKEEV